MFLSVKLGFEISAAIGAAGFVVSALHDITEKKNADIGNRYLGVIDEISSIDEIPQTDTTNIDELT